MRAKWSAPIRKYWKISEQMMVKYCDLAICDSVNIEKYIHESCLTKKAYGTQPGHTQFYYPKKYGYGELWLRMADSIKGQIEYNKTVKAIDFTTRTVTTADGMSYQADKIITTIRANTAGNGWLAGCAQCIPRPSPGWHKTTLATWRTAT